jgi:nitroreductase
MDAIDNILNRVSARLLKEPYPSKEEMSKVYKGALRAPDHAWLRPSSFIEVSGNGIKKLSKIFEEYAKTIPKMLHLELQ